MWRHQHGTYDLLVVHAYTLLDGQANIITIRDCPSGCATHSDALGIVILCYYVHRLAVVVQRGAHVTSDGFYATR